MVDPTRMRTIVVSVTNHGCPGMADGDQVTAPSDQIAHILVNYAQHRLIVEGIDTENILPRADVGCDHSRRPKTEPRHDVAAAEAS